LSFAQILERLETDKIGKKEKERLTSKYNQLISAIKNKNNQPSFFDEGLDLQSLGSEKAIYLKEPSSHITKPWFRYNESNRDEIIYFHHFDSHSNSEDNFEKKVNILCEELKKGLNKLDVEVLSKAEIYNKDHNLTLIINISGVRFKNSDELQSFFNLLKRKINFKFLACKIIIETCLPNDICQENSDKIINTDFAIKHVNGVSLSNNIDYVLYRNKAYEKFKKGGQIGNFSENEYNLPLSLIKEKIDAFPMQNTEWKVLNIFGSPGSGKSEFLKYYTQNILKSDESIKIILNNSVEVDELFGNQDLTTKKKFVTCLVHVLCSPTNNFLKEYDISKDSLLGVADALIKLILERGKKIFLIIDDYHIRKNTVPLVNRIIEKNWNIKLIIAGRSILDISKNAISSFQTSLWTRNEAKLILNYWLEDDDEAVLTALNTKWVYEEKLYSTYLLRIIKNHIQFIQDSSPSILLFQEIEKILSPVYDDLKNIIPDRRVSNTTEEIDIFRKYVFETSEIKSIEKLRSIINNEITKVPQEFDLNTFINDIGLISLIGRLENGERNLDPNRILKLSRVVKLKSEAQKLLISGSEAGMFTPYNQFTESIEWKDSLIADGCIALRLIYDMSKINITSTEKEVSPFIKTLQILKNKNSIYILKLALDEDFLIHLIKLNIKYDINSSNEINENLLTDNLLSKLQHSESKIKQLFDTIIENLYNLSKEKSYISTAKLLLKVIGNNQALKKQIFSLIPLEDPVGKTAIATYSLFIEDKTRFFKDIDKLNVSREKSLEIALQVWNLNHTELIIDRMEEVLNYVQSGKKEKIVKWWNLRLSGRNIDDLKVILEQLVQRCFNLKKESELILILIETTYLKVKAEGKRVLYSNTDYFANKISFTFNRLKDEKKYKTLSKLIKWYVYFLSPDLFREDVEWEYNSYGEYAIPVKQYEAKNIIDILNQIPPKSIFSIPHSSEILKLKGFYIGTESSSFEENSEELVSDRFPSNFQYEYEDYSIKTDSEGNNTISMQATQIGVWNGSKQIDKTDFVPRKEQLTIKLKWRPKLILQLIEINVL